MGEELLEGGGLGCPRKGIVMSERPAGIADVARVSGVSMATVSRVLNGNVKVRPELVKRVEAAVQEVNYRPNGAGRALRRQRSDLWAAIVPDGRNPFFVRLVDAFEKVANAEGFSVVLCNTREDLAREKAAIETVLAHQVSGVLIAAASPDGRRLKSLEGAGVPVVMVDRRVTGFRGDSVCVDNEQIGRLAAEHLLSQGRVRPLILNHSMGLSPMGDRELGFRAEMAAAGHPVTDDRSAHLGFDLDRPQDAIVDLFVAHGEIDSVFATTNTLTMDAFGALRSLGLRIGPDVALLGVDDDRWNVMVEPQVTVVEQPAEQLGTWAGQLLATRSDGRMLDNAKMLLEPVLRVRASSLRSPA